MATTARPSAPPLADTPLGRTIATTATDIWNDSCAVEELEYAISYGAVGATANPTIVADVWKADPGRWRDRVRTLAEMRPDATEVDLAWAVVEEMSLRAAPLLLPAFAASGGRQGRLSMQTDPTLFRTHDRMLAQGEGFARLAPNIIVKFPATTVGVRVMEEATYRGVSVNATVSFSVAQAVAAAEAVERGPAPTRGRGSRRRRHGPGHHADDGPPRGLAAGPDRARRHRRRPRGPAVVGRRGLQAGLRGVPGARPARPAARRGDPTPPPLVGAHRWRRGHHDAGGLATPLQRVVGRGPAADRRPGRSGHRR